MEPYQEALDKAGHNFKLKYSEAEGNPESSNKKKRSRTRRVIRFIPPFNNGITNNVGKWFLSLISKHFSNDQNLKRLFNRNTLKTSYRTGPNLKQQMSRHNRRVINDYRGRTGQQHGSSRQG